ncbi:MAG: hypothetical protein ABIS45_09575 [Burkholderiales bacterium]
MPLKAINHHVKPFELGMKTKPENRDICRVRDAEMAAYWRAVKSEITGLKGIFFAE